MRTIEGVLFDALVRAGAVSSDNADDPVKVEHLHDACYDALLRDSIFLGKSWARGSHRRGSPRSRQPGIYETDHRDPWGGRLGSTCKRRTPTRDSCLGLCMHSLSFTKQKITLKWLRSAYKTHSMLACEFASVISVDHLTSCFSGLATAASTPTSSPRTFLYLRSRGRDFSVHMHNMHSLCRALSLWMLPLIPFGVHPSLILPALWMISHASACGG